MSETKNVLIFQGGFDGHEPDKIAERFAKLMKKHGYTCRIYDTLDILLDREFVKAQDLIIPSWTRGELSEEACRNLSDAVAFGTGLAGCHGGMCSAFRNSREWLCMTGGLWKCWQAHVSPPLQDTTVPISL